MTSNHASTRHKQRLWVTICAFTSDPTDAPLFRLPIDPSDRNGLRSTSRLMVDKITTVARDKLDERIGRLDDNDMVRLNRAILVFLGLAQRSQSEPRVAPAAATFAGCTTGNHSEHRRSLRSHKRRLDSGSVPSASAPSSELLSGARGGRKTRYFKGP